MSPLFQQGNLYLGGNAINSAYLGSTHLFPINITVEFVGSSNKRVLKGTTTGAGTTITLSGLQADDVVFLTHTSDVTTASTLNSSSADLSSSTWTQVTGVATTTPDIGLWYTVSTGTSVTVDVEYAPTTDFAAYVLCLYAFRGCNTTAPIYSVGNKRGNTNNLILADIDPPPSFDTYAVGLGSLDDDIDVIFSMPVGYTEIFQGESSGVFLNTATMVIAYTPLYANTAITGKSFTANASDEWNTFQFYLIPDGF